MKHNRVIYISSIVGLAVLLLMLNITSPTEIGPLGVLLFFTTVYAVSLGVFCFLIQAFLRLAIKKQTFSNKDYLHVAVLSFLPIMLLMARSFGAFNLWTISLILAFIALAEFLIYKRI